MNVTQFIFDLFIFCVIMAIIEYATTLIQYKKFKKQLKKGKIIWKIITEIDNEFDEGFCTMLIIDKVGNKQIKCHYANGNSSINKNIKRLFEENWQILDDKLYNRILTLKKSI